MKITILVDNCAALPSSLGSRLIAEWGFSAYLHEPRILYDTGLTGIALINNMRALEMDPDDPDYLVLSHGHVDHTGGMIKLMDMRTRPLTVVAHEEAFSRNTGFTIDDLRRRNARVIAIREPYTVAGNVIASGGIPRRWGPSHLGGVADEVPDDMALYIKTGSGLVVVTGCGHSGPENIVEYGLQLTGAGKLRAIMGGLHFMGLGRARMDEAAGYLASRNPEMVAAMHCTGIEGQAVLMGMLGGRFRVGGVGSTFEFDV
jgi:7,8-dihydropterin-6-yl-methyl-4-(beta-D-ribofuranosyl)aminobenzene 5'-phosphate synthase